MKIKLIAPREKYEGLLNWHDPLGMRKNKGWALPLALPTLAALTPPDINVSIVDENVEPIDFEEKIDLVGISFMTPAATRAYEIADEFRKRGICVVLGGIHVSMLPEEGAKHADSVVIGEAEDIWSDLINDFKNGRLKNVYRCDTQADLNKSPIPRWDLGKATLYNFHMLQISRGCPFDCDFCSVKVFLGEGVRYKPIGNIIKELEFLKKLDTKKIIFFADDNILGDIEHLKDLLNSIMPLNIRWFCQASINLAQHSKLLEAMYKSGCRQVFIGFESLSQESLDLMNKGRTNRVNEYVAAVDKIHSYGISVFGSFMLGNDGDDKEIFSRTIEFINKSNIVFSLINIITPPPGTRLYKKLQEENRISTYDWEKYTGEWVCFQPKKMSAEELQQKYYITLQNIYSYDAILKRLNVLWGRGLLIKRGNDILNKFAKERLYLSIRGILDNDRARRKFILRSLWNPKTTALSPLLMAMSFHDFAFRKNTHV